MSHLELQKCIAMWKWNKMLKGELRNCNNCPWTFTMDLPEIKHSLFITHWLYYIMCLLDIRYSISVYFALFTAVLHWIFLWGSINYINISLCLRKHAPVCDSKCVTYYFTCRSGVRRWHSLYKQPEIWFSGLGNRPGWVITVHRVILNIWNIHQGCAIWSFLHTRQINQLSMQRFI